MPCHNDLIVSAFHPLGSDAEVDHDVGWTERDGK
jgi:hypothetical protein